MPKKKQIKTCRICGAEGTNAKTCPGNPDAKHTIPSKHAPNAAEFKSREIARQIPPHPGTGTDINDLPNEILIMIFSDPDLTLDELYEYAFSSKRMMSIVNTVLSDRYRRAHPGSPIPESINALFGRDFIERKRRQQAQAAEAAAPKPKHKKAKGRPRPERMRGLTTHNPRSKAYNPDEEFSVYDFEENPDYDDY